MQWGGIRAFARLAGEISRLVGGGLGPYAGHLQPSGPQD
jgi:hypothetical protein